MTGFPIRYFRVAEMGGHKSSAERWLIALDPEREKYLYNGVRI